MNCNSTALVNYSLDQSPSWDANSHPASQETSGLLWSPKAHYRAHKSPSLISYPESEESSPKHAIIFLYDPFYYYSHPHLGLPSDLFPSGFLTEALYVFLIYLVRAEFPANLTHF
jgi:hypothetical protein